MVGPARAAAFAVFAGLLAVAGSPAAQVEALVVAARVAYGLPPLTGFVAQAAGALASSKVDSGAAPSSSYSSRMEAAGLGVSKAVEAMLWTALAVSVASPLLRWLLQWVAFRLTPGAASPPGLEFLPGWNPATAVMAAYLLALSLTERSLAPPPAVAMLLDLPRAAAGHLSWAGSLLA